MDFLPALGPITRAPLLSSAARPELRPSIFYPAPVDCTPALITQETAPFS
jgi:hypothetical protein